MCNIPCLKKRYLIKKSWKKEEDEIDILAYKHVLFRLINKIDIPLCAIHCKNMFCKDTDHYYSAVNVSYLKAVSRCILTTNKPNIAGWNDNVMHFKDQSVFGIEFVLTFDVGIML